MPEQLFAAWFVNARKRSLTLTRPPLCDRAFVMRGSSCGVFLVGLILESGSGHGIERPRRGIAVGGIWDIANAVKPCREGTSVINVGCHGVCCSVLGSGTLADAAEETSNRRTSCTILVDRHTRYRAAYDAYAAVAAIVVVGPFSFCVIRRVQSIRIADETANQELRSAVVVLVVTLTVISSTAQPVKVTVPLA